MKNNVVLTLLLFTVLFVGVLYAQEGKDATPKGFKGEFLTQLADVQDKIVSLAEAMPQDKFVWRPAEGVRSVSEVFMHIAGANYMFPTVVGVKKPEGLTPDMEKTVTDKAKVIEVLKQSFEHVRKAMVSVADEDLDKKVDLFDHETTYRGVFFTTANHMHEHLGQAIAYARMNGVVPPWTAKEQAEAAKKKAEKK